MSRVLAERHETLVFRGQTRTRMDGRGWRRTRKFTLAGTKAPSGQKLIIFCGTGKLSKFQYLREKKRAD